MFYNLQEAILYFGSFINKGLIPLLFALALLFFVYNVFRYFIIKGDDAASKESAKQLAIYGILAFVILISFWGIINLLVRSFGINSDRPITPDYIEENSYYYF